MSSKLKKAILAVVIVLVVAVGGIVIFSSVTKISSTTVYDLRIIESETKAEIFEKEVYLTADDNNSFNIELKASASAMTNFVVSSSDSSVATVSVAKGHYIVSYYKVGTVDIVAKAPDNSAVNDSFKLHVKESYPISFNVTDSENKDNEVSIYADDTDYAFDFVAKSVSDGVPVNNETLSVLDDYNKDIFELIEIDAENSKLVIKAKQSVESIIEYITVVCKTTDQKTGKKTINNYTVKINVFGNYIEDMQLILSSRPNFDGTVYVCGEGKLKDGEVRVGQDRLIFCQDVNIVYAKVRILFTNGVYIDATKSAETAGISSDSKIQKSKPGLNYYQIELCCPEGIKFEYIHSYMRDGQVVDIETVDKEFDFKFLSTTGTEYQSFLENKLYKKTVSESGSVVFEYVHWDERYKREDAITKNGEIIGFKNGNPACGE